MTMVLQKTPFTFNKFEKLTLKLMYLCDDVVVTVPPLRGNDNEEIKE